MPLLVSPLLGIMKNGKYTAINLNYYKRPYLCLDAHWSRHAVHCCLRSLLFFDSLGDLV